MELMDSTKIEVLLSNVRWWLYRRRAQPSHWFALCGSFGTLAAVGLILAAAKAIGVGPVLALAFFGGALGWAIAGQKSEE